MFKNRTTSSVVIKLVFITAIVFTAWFGTRMTNQKSAPKGWDDRFLKIMLSECIGTGKTDLFCGCYTDEIRKKIAWNDFYNASTAFQAGQEPKPEIKNAIISIAEECEGRSSKIR